MAEKPDAVFDRDREWRELERFAGATRPGASMGIVSGRRRQGKTLLLRSLAGAVGGLHHEAVEAEPAEALRRLAADYAAHLRLPVPPAFHDWEAALRALLALGEESPRLVVLDELPYLVRGQPSLPSLIQRSLSPGSSARERSRTRLILCGSALSVMGGLTRTDAPLRGRASLELLVHPLPYRDAARFWGLDQDPATAFRVHALLGGTPAYRTDLADFDAPRGPDDFDDWVVRAVLNPGRPLFREGRVLVTEEPGLRERALYHSVLAAVAEGHETRERIASRVGRPAAALTHALTVLLDAGLLERREDAFRRQRPTYRIAEPLVRFHHLVIRPNLTTLETLGEGDRVWAAAQHTVAARILGPHFEDLCRDWVLRHTDPDELGGLVSAVGAGVVQDPSARRSHEVDVVAWTARADGGRRASLLGEAKVGPALGRPAVQRLRSIREAAARAGHDVEGARLALFCAAGFTHELRADAARTDELMLVDLDRLYHGS